MKVRNYEKKDLIMLLSIILIIIELFCLFILFNAKENKYFKINGIVVKDDLVLAVLDKKSRKKVYSNGKLYLNDKIKKYKIREDRGIVMKKNKKNYYELILELDLKNKKTNDVLELVIEDNRFRMIEIFKIIWEGD